MKPFSVCKHNQFVVKTLPLVLHYKQI